MKTRAAWLIASTGFLTGLKRRYQRMLHGTLNTRPVVIVFALIVLCLIPVFLKFTQSQLAPDEDQGIIFMIASAPQPTNLDYLNTYTDEFINNLQGVSGVLLVVPDQWLQRRAIGHRRFPAQAVERA